MRRPHQRPLGLTAYLAFGVAAWIFLGLVARADEGDVTNPPTESDGGAAIADLDSGTDIRFGNEVGTITSSNLRGQAALEQGIGKRAYFQSLSAINLQKAIDLYLDNNRERIESYYQMREYRDAKVADRTTVTQEQAVRFAKEKAPNRLTSQDLDPETGSLYWPKPLDDKVLEPYTRLINQQFAMRSDNGQRYTDQNARMVQRMVTLMQAAVDSIKDELPVREYIALSDYLSSISYEASFDLAGERLTQ